MHSNEEAIDSPSPSFNSYFNTDLAKLVSRVATEFVTVDDEDDDFFSGKAQNDEISFKQNEDLAEDGEFEFNLLAPADGDAYPVFDRGLLRDYDLVNEVSRSQIQLKNLFLEDREANRSSISSSSSSSEDDLEEIPDGTYCVWLPSKSRLSSASPGRCTKSNSTGSVTEKVKAWKLTDLLNRSHSDGKDRSGMIMLTRKKKKQEATMASKKATLNGYLIGAAQKNKRRSYLPYRQDLIALPFS